MISFRWGLAGAIAGVLTVAGLALSGTREVVAADHAPIATPWVKDHASRARLIAGGAGLSQAAPRMLAGVEIELDEGWKTYWRHPGSSGVPPRLDWAGSTNVKDVKLLFPSPHRFSDREGDTIGYKSRVVLPVVVTPQDASQPVELKLSMDYGVCKDVCIPVQSSLELLVPSDIATRAAGPELVTALAQVPRSADDLRADDPRLLSVNVELRAQKPSITLRARFPGDSQTADVFLEAPDGMWLPFAKRLADAADGSSLFIVDLTDGAEIDDLKGKTIRVTLVGKSGQSESTFRLE